ncbi:hypothetical protein BDN72DRAFT_728239, partial [Pluteus cervinus]
ALRKRPPFCTGVTPLENNGILFYRKGERKEAGYLDFADITEDDLENLHAACSPASSCQDYEGDNQSHQTVRKLDTYRFSSLIDIHSSGIAQHVSNELLEGEDSKRRLYFELDKLNIGMTLSDSCCKPHTDTPRAESIFGSLVIMFSTSHVGGTFVLHHDDEEWAVDSSLILSQQTQPSICFVAFYNDVEHEVLPLRSGYRVTLTYNLYTETPEKHPEIPELPTIPIHRSAPDEFVFKSALTTFLQNSDVFPEGGVLAFGLRFKYPFVPSKTKIQQLIHVL